MMKPLFVKIVKGLAINYFRKEALSYIDIWVGSKHAPKY